MLSTRNLIALCEAVEELLLSTVLSTTVRDVFISCAFNNAVKMMPETLKYNEELLVFCSKVKALCVIASEDMQDTENEINKKWQVTGCWVL